MFSRRLQKSKIKDLERQIRLYQLQARSNPSVNKQLESLQDEYKSTKKQVFTDERKIDQRKQGFSKAKINMKKNQLSEFAN